MITIDEAIKELSDRMELYTDYPSVNPSFRDARRWLDTLRMSRDALLMQKQNIETKHAILEDLGELKLEDKFTVDLVVRLIGQFRTGDDKHDTARS